MRSSKDRLLFLGFCLLGALVAAIVLGLDRWFIADEWMIISQRPFTVEGLLGNHSGHWISLPIVLYKALYQQVGFQSYVPYQSLALAAHLGIVLLIFQLMRRMSVPAWLALTTCTALALFGSGAFNITIGFQISLNGSLFCGLLCLLLTDSRQTSSLSSHLPIVLLATIGLMTSAVMVPMVVGLAAAVLLRRGPLLAAVYALLPASVFAAWYLNYGLSGRGASNLGTLAQTLEMVVRLSTETLLALGQHAIGALILGALIAYGLLASCREAYRAGSWDTLTLPTALATAWLGFSCAAAMRAGNLSFDPDLPAAPRYLHIGAALLLPLAALGGAQLAKLRPALALAPVLVLAFGLPANIQALRDYSLPERYRQQVLATVHSPLLDQVPGDHMPFKGAYIHTSAAWLRTERDLGKFPPYSLVDDDSQLNAESYLALSQLDRAQTHCTPRPGPTGLTVHRGDKMVFADKLSVSLVRGNVSSKPRMFDAARGPLAVLAGPLELEIGGGQESAPFYCMVREGTTTTESQNGNSHL